MAENDQLLYPDVLGKITENRVSVGSLQYAVGAYPRRAFIHQPLEIVLLLQSMVDQNMRVKVGIRPPTKDRRGNPAIVEIDKKTFTLGLRPGEVGALRIPIMPLPPTRPGTGYPVQVAVRYRLPAGTDAKIIRPPRRGVKPSNLKMSPYKIQAFQEITFEAVSWYESTEVVTTFFDIAQKVMPKTGNQHKSNYETLWSNADMEDEIKFVRQKGDAEAQHIALDLRQLGIYEVLISELTEMYTARGINLYSGEVEAAAHMCLYVIDRAVRGLDYLELEEMRWFNTLAQLVAHNPDVADLSAEEIIRDYLIDSIVYDACMVGYKLLDEKSIIRVQSIQEHQAYINELLLWLAGNGVAELRYLYEPLIFGGLLINHVGLLGANNPKDTLLDLRETRHARQRELPEDKDGIIATLDKLLIQAQRNLVGQFGSL